ncbi:hypothetical protein DCO48_05745 [Pseudomonas sp. SDI]|uniref:hypothetical protein n=1 Tax=Pseudomonas sp. SDI TaxID=2170734 RepID=UPI000DE74690|nr:hypothetical protein [Pseudomonas sp. SDI]PWB34646.1 hypothetical protein DCO48_05745 [Pseudomonas sp. SDI]
MTIQIVLPGKVQVQLETAIRHYRNAAAALGEAVQSEAWDRIYALQSNRDLQAHTIALIVNGTPISFVAEGGQA